MNQNQQHKKCSKCKCLKLKTEFYKDKRTKSKLQSECKVCHKSNIDAIKRKEYRKQYYIKNKQKSIKQSANWNSNNKEARKNTIFKYESSKKGKMAKRKKVLKKYGLTLENYETLYKNQEGKCAICETHYEVLCVDHDHKTNKVRGLLCKSCNKGLGIFGDTENGVQKALQYLTKNTTSKIGYCCMTDFDWELGEALGGTEIYASIEDLRECRKCVDQCGIVKVRIEFEEEVEPSKGWQAL